MKSRIFTILFVVFSTVWFFTVSFVRIYDVTLDDKLSLLSRMPSYYVFALFALAFLSLLSFYQRKVSWSVAFAALFALYFLITPYFVEPLRIIDTFFHFSRVPVVIESGHLPASQRYYFDYPGSTIFGGMFLSVTAMEPLLFMKYFFPLLSTMIFCLGFVLVVKRMFRSWSPTGPSLLLISLFGYGGYIFSPFGFAWMIIPFLLLSAMSQRKRSFYVCFVLLTISLAISHPTTSAFLIVALPAFVLALRVGQKIPVTIHKLITSRVLVFIAVILTWSGLITYTLIDNVGLFISSMLETLFFHSGEVPEKVWQPAHPIFEISLLRRTFVILSGILMAVVLLKSLRIILKSNELKIPRKEWICLSIAFVSTGLLFFLLLSVSQTSVYGFSYCFMFGLFGTTMSFGLLNATSRRGFFLSLLLVLSLIVPAFITQYPVEHRDVMRDSVRYGLIFTGRHIKDQNARILSPFGNQLYSFMDFEMWQTIMHLIYGPELFSQILYADYFVFRIDGLYFAAIDVERLPATETAYFRVFTASLSNNSFNLVYSSSEYQILARH